MADNETHYDQVIKLQKTSENRSVPVFDFEKIAQGPEPLHFEFYPYVERVFKAMKHKSGTIDDVKEEFNPVIE